MVGMSTMQRRRQMRSLLARRDREGLTYQELSDESGVPAGTLASWQYRLREEAGDEAFTELVVEGDTGGEFDGRLEVIGPRGHRVIVTAEVDRSLLELVLSALPC